MAHVLQKSKEFLITHDEVRIGRLEDYKIKKLIAKRKKHIPLAYITGHKEFFGLDFVVNKNTLVPRPDTETLVEEVIQQIKKLSPSEKIFLIDVGTGSGCIPISVVKSLQVGKSAGLQVFATDISQQALKVAKHNAKMHETKITFLQGNLLEPLSKKRENKKTKKLIEHYILTANLPYLTEQQFDEEPSIQKEPYSALVAPDQGLALYKELLRQVQKYIPPSSLTCFFEIDPAQTTLLCNWIPTLFPQAKIEVLKDLSGTDRVMKITI